jgi:UDP-N-acetylmuramate--alanine ligase
MTDHYHVAGVAGVGMSAVAQVLLAEGFTVTGSDRYLDQGQDLDVLDRLAAAGVRLVKQDGAAVTPATAGVVVSTAIEADNPDITAANRHNVSVIHRADMLARLAKNKTCIAVTGTSGKTTVTGLIGVILEELGRDPTVVNGGVVLNWTAPDRVGNVRIGRSGLWVVEADESDKSLLHFSPDWAVITNISKDHFELSEVTELFREFETRVKHPVVHGVDASFAPRRDGATWYFDFKDVTFRVPMIGRHNAENAYVAVQLCDRLGLDLDEVREALLRFKGIQRRLEHVGERNGVIVIDDYAHNPAKVAASWTAVAESAPRILGFWRPHGYGPLALMKNEMADAFAGVCRPGDRVYILPVYYVGGTASKAITSEGFVDLLCGKGVKAEYVAGYDELRAAVDGTARPGDVILGMGARDPELPRFARALVDA